MIKPLLSFALAAVLFPSIASAAVININYTGYVSGTEGNGLGHSVGELVSGHVKIDLTKALGVNTPSANVANYYAADDEHNLISGYHSSAIGKSADFVDVNDAAYEYNGAFEDFLKVSDSDSEFILDSAFNYTSNFYSFYLELIFPGIDWFSGNDLQGVNLNITDATALTASRAQMYNVFAIGNGTNYTVQADVAYISLNSLRITSTTGPQVVPVVNVPESNIALLLIIALAGLCAGRLCKEHALHN
ncbi:MAG TPA: hypothetical protein VIM59_02785 [Cellvibrio sp.]